MSDLLADIFGVVPSSDEAILAKKQIDSDSSFLNQMILERHKTYENPAEFADEIGVSLELLEDFEADPLDFDLMFIRQYAHTLNLFINHEVIQASALNEKPRSSVSNRMVDKLLAEHKASWHLRKSQGAGRYFRKVV